MRKLLSLVFLAGIALPSYAYRSVPVHHKIKTKFRVTGSIMQTTAYCGGAKPPQAILDSLNTPKGIPFGKLFIRPGKKNASRAVKTYIIKADENGNFCIHLPAGHYCLVEEWKAKRFKLPLNDADHRVDSSCYRNLYSTCDFTLDIINKNLAGIKFVFHRSCPNNQPCISYHGPLHPSKLHPSNQKK